MTTNPRLRRLPLLLLLFLACALCIGCKALDTPKVPASERLANFAATLTDVVVQLKGTQFILEKAPHLMPILDLDRNGVLSLAELASIDLEEPATLVLLFLALEELIKRG